MAGGPGGKSLGLRPTWHSLMSSTMNVGAIRADMINIGRAMVLENCNNTGLGEDNS